MTVLNNRANALVERLILGANSLATFAEGLSESDWNKPVLGDGRTVGVVIHHVANVYPLEIELAQVLASGNSITDATTKAEYVSLSSLFRFSFSTDFPVISRIQRTAGFKPKVR